MQEDPKYPKEKQLVTVSAYAEKWKLNRHTVYRLMADKDHPLTRYVGLDGEPMLDPEEEPKGVKAYQDRPEYPKNGDDTD